MPHAILNASPGLDKEDIQLAEGAPQNLRNAFNAWQQGIIGMNTFHDVTEKLPSSRREYIQAPGYTNVEGGYRNDKTAGSAGSTSSGGGGIGIGVIALVGFILAWVIS